MKTFLWRISLRELKFAIHTVLIHFAHPLHTWPLLKKRPAGLINGVEKKSSNGTGFKMFHFSIFTEKFCQIQYFRKPLHFDEIFGEVHFSYPIEFPQVFLLFLVNHNVDTGDGLGDNTDFAELGSGTAGHFSHTKAAQLGFEVIELLDQLFLLLGTQFGALDTRLKVKIKFVLLSVNLTRYFSPLQLTNVLTLYFKNVTGNV